MEYHHGLGLEVVYRVVEVCVVVAACTVREAWEVSKVEAVWEALESKEYMENMESMTMTVQNTIDHP
jgi:hypothetical protein